MEPELPIYTGPCYWLSDNHSLLEPRLSYQLTWMTTMINCGLRADTVSRGKEEPKLGTDRTPKPGLPECCRLHRAMSIGRYAVGQPTRARGKGDGQQRVFIPMVAEGCSGPWLWSIPEDLLVPPHPIARLVPTEEAQGIGELCRAGSCTPLLTRPEASGKFPPYPSH